MCKFTFLFQVLVAEIEQKQSNIDECQKHSEQYSSAIKVSLFACLHSYDSCLTLTQTLTQTLSIPALRQNDDITLTFTVKETKTTL